MTSPVPSVRVYLTERIIDGSRYGEEICARSYDEAVEIAARTMREVRRGAAEWLRSFR